MSVQVGTRRMEEGWRLCQKDKYVREIGPQGGNINKKGRSWRWTTVKTNLRFCRHKFNFFGLLSPVQLCRMLLYLFVSDMISSHSRYFSSQNQPVLHIATISSLIIHIWHISPYVTIGNRCYPPSHATASNSVHSFYWSVSPFLLTVIDWQKKTTLHSHSVSGHPWKQRLGSQKLYRESPKN